MELRDGHFSERELLARVIAESDPPVVSEWQVAGGEDAAVRNILPAVVA